MLSTRSARAARLRGKVEKIHVQEDGSRLVTKRYRLPEPTLSQEGGCGGAAPPVRHVNPEDLRTLLYLHAAESDRFRDIVDALQPGLGRHIEQDAGAGIDSAGSAGSALAGLIRWSHARGLSQYLVRASMIDSDRDATRFLMALDNPETCEEMRLLSPLLPTKRDKVAELDITRKLRKWGLRLKPAIKVALGAKLQEKREAVVLGLSAELHALILGLGGGAGG